MTLDDFYVRNGSLFTKEQQEMLDAMRAQRKAENVNYLVDVPKQLVAGFIQGFTTIDFGAEPVDTVTGLARSIGSLVGFMGYVPTPGIFGKIGLTKVVESFGVHKFLPESSIRGMKAFMSGPAFVPVKSIPIQIADKIVESGGEIIVKSSAARAALNVLGKPDSLVRDLLKGGVHLGVASAVSAAQPWEINVRDRMTGFMQGVEFGAVNRLIGNAFQVKGGLVDASKVFGGDVNALGGAERFNGLVRGIAGAMYMGLPSTLRNEPLPIQVYDYLLGGWFGWAEKPKHVRRAQEVLKDYNSDYLKIRHLLLPERFVKGFEKEDPLVQEEIRHNAELMHGRIIETSEGLLTETGALPGLAFVDMVREQLKKTNFDKLTKQNQKLYSMLAEFIDAKGVYEIPVAQAMRMTYASHYKALVESGMTPEEARIRAAGDMGDQIEAYGTIIDRVVAVGQNRNNPDAVRISDLFRAMEDTLATRIRLGHAELALEDGVTVAESLADRNVPRTFHTPLESILKAAKGQVQSELTTMRDELADMTSGIIEKQRAGTLDDEGAVSSLFAQLKSKYPTFDMRPEAKRRVLQSWVRLSQNRTVPQSVFDIASRTFIPHTKAALKDAIADQYAPRSIVEETFDALFADVPAPEGMEPIPTMSKISYAVFDGMKYPLTTMLDGGVPERNTKAAIPALNPNVFVARALEGGAPIVFSTKDKGTFWSVRNLIESDNEAAFYADALEAELARPGKELERKKYAHEANIWMKDLTEAGYTQENASHLWRMQQANRLKALEVAFGGKDIPWQTLLSNDSALAGMFVTQDVDQTNKYFQVTVSPDYKVSEQTYARIPGLAAMQAKHEAKGLPYIILESNSLDGGPLSAFATREQLGAWEIDPKTGKANLSVPITYLDGGGIVLPEVLKTLRSGVGLEPMGGRIKGSVYDPAIGQNVGALISKQMFHPASGQLAEWMRTQGIPMVLFRSTAKQPGMREIGSFAYVDAGEGKGEYRFKRADGSDGIPQVYDLPYDKMRVNISVSEEMYRSAKDQSPSRQFLSLMEDPENIKYFVDRAMAPYVPNKAWDEFVSKYQDDQTLTYDEGTFSPRMLSLQQRLDIISGRTRAPEKMLREIVKEIMDKDLAVEEGELLEMEKREVTALMDANMYSSATARILELTREITPFLLNTDKNIRKHFDYALKNYIARETLRIPQEGSFTGNLAVLQPEDMQYMYEGEAMFERGLAEQKMVKSPLTGERKSLYKLILERRADILAGKNVTEWNNWEVVVQRVPSDSRSRMIVVRPSDHIINSDGAGLRLHHNDMQRISGADNDGDTYFVYTEMPKSVHSELKRAYNEDFDYRRVGSDGTILPGNAPPDALGVQKFMRPFFNEFIARRLNDEVLEDGTTMDQQTYRKKSMVGVLSPRQMVASHVYATEGNSNLGIGLGVYRNLRLLMRMVKPAENRTGEQKFKVDLVKEQGFPNGLLNITGRDKRFDALLAELSRRGIRLDGASVSMETPSDEHMRKMAIAVVNMGADASKGLPLRKAGDMVAAIWGDVCKNVRISLGGQDVTDLLDSMTEHASAVAELKRRAVDKTIGKSYYTLRNLYALASGVNPETRKSMTFSEAMEYWKRKGKEDLPGYVPNALFEVLRRMGSLNAEGIGVSPMLRREGKELRNLWEYNKSYNSAYNQFIVEQMFHFDLGDTELPQAKQQKQSTVMSVLRQILMRQDTGMSIKPGSFKPRDYRQYQDFTGNDAGHIVSHLMAMEYGARVYNELYKAHMGKEVSKDEMDIFIPTFAERFKVSPGKAFFEGKWGEVDILNLTRARLEDIAVQAIGFRDLYRARSRVEKELNDSAINLPKELIEEARATPRAEIDKAVADWLNTLREKQGDAAADFAATYLMGSLIPQDTSSNGLKSQLAPFEKVQNAKFDLLSGIRNDMKKLSPEDPRQIDLARQEADLVASLAEDQASIDSIKQDFYRSSASMQKAGLIASIPDRIVSDFFTRYSRIGQMYASPEMKNFARLAEEFSHSYMDVEGKQHKLLNTEDMIRYEDIVRPDAEVEKNNFGGGVIRSIANNPTYYLGKQDPITGEFGRPSYVQDVSLFRVINDPYLKKFLPALAEIDLSKSPHKEEYLQMRHDLARIFGQFPQFWLNNFSKIFAGYRSQGMRKGVAPELYVLSDMRRIIRDYEGIMSGRKPGMPLSPLHYFMMPEHIAEIHRLAGDMQVIEVGRIPVVREVFSGLEKKVGEPEEPVFDFFSTQGVLQRALSNMIEAQSGIRQTWVNKMHRMITESNMRRTEVGGDWERIFKYAVAEAERHDAPKDGMGRPLVDTYEKEYQKHLADVKELESKTWTFSPSGDTVRTYTFNEALAEMRTLLEKMLEPYSLLISDPYQQRTFIERAGRRRLPETRETMMKLLRQLVAHPESSTPGGLSNIMALSYNTVDEIAHQMYLEQMRVKRNGKDVPLDSLHSAERIEEVHRMLDDAHRNFGGRFDWKSVTPPRWPHTGWSPEEVRTFTENKIRDGLIDGDWQIGDIADNETSIKRLVLRTQALTERMQRADRGIGQDVLDVMEVKGIDEKDFVNSLLLRGGHDRFAAPGKDNVIPGWDKSPEAIIDSGLAVIDATYNKLMGILGHTAIRDFERRMPFGEDTPQWANFFRQYVRQVIGFPSMLPEAYVNDPKMYLNARNPYYLTTDEFWTRFFKNHKIKSVRGFGQLFEPVYGVGHSAYTAAQTAFMSQNATPEQQKALAKLGVLYQKNNVGAFTAWAARTEGKFSMMSLLAHTKGFINNLTGSTMYTYVNTGFEPMRKALDIKRIRELFSYKVPEETRKKMIHDLEQRYLQNRETMLRNRDPMDTTHVQSKEEISDRAIKEVNEILREGEYQINTWEDVFRLVSQQGGIESFLNAEIFSGQNMTRDRVRGMMDALNAEFEKDGKDITKVWSRMDDYRAIARKFGVADRIFDIASIPMRKSEVYGRTFSWLSHIIKMRESMDYTAGMSPLDPFLVDVANKGVAFTQFLYNNANRPLFASTSVGRIFSRFQMWSWNSVRLNNQVYKSAKEAGFQEGTEEYARFRRLVTANMFSLGLASIFPSSIFEATLPAPISWMQDLSAMVFGNDEEKDRAFFGVLPYPFNALQMISPPSSRFLYGTFNLMFTGDLDKFLSYQAWTFFPFGRFAKDVVKTAEVPVMGVENLTGFPLHRMYADMKEKKHPTVTLRSPFAGIFSRRGEVDETEENEE